MQKLLISSRKLCDGLIAQIEPTKKRNENLIVPYSSGKFKAKKHHLQMVFIPQHVLLENVYLLDQLEWPLGDQNL